MQRLHLYPPLRTADEAGRILCRIAWYFHPYLDRIDGLVVTAEPGVIAAAERAPHLDPAVSALLPALKARVRSTDPRGFDRAMAEIDPGRDILLIWNEEAERGASPALRAAVRTLTPVRGIYRVDPDRTRMEGSHYLWAGLNRFADSAARLAEGRRRMAAMIAEIGRHDRATVFGTGPSLSGFVEGRDFSGGLSIVANSIVKNRAVIAATRPQVIVAADPLYHAGVSDYAGSFRSELVHALDETGAWFVCPLRDLAIHEAWLPERFRDRMIGMPFDDTGPPPVDLGRQFYWKPYPNVLTLALLPLASTLADRIEVAGCDGRRLTDDSFFWSHDRKVQFTDKMAGIQAAHPAFFAIDYNDYYTSHCRDLEEVAETLEDAGREIVTVTRSMIPALATRPAPALQDPPRPGLRLLAVIDPDARDAWGHFLAYDKRLAEAAAQAGLDCALVARAELDPGDAPPALMLTLPCLTAHSWHLGKDWPCTRRDALLTFAREMDAALDRLEAEAPEGGIALFIYVGGLEVAEILEHLLIGRPRVSAVVNLFWAYNFDETDAAYRKTWERVARRLMRSPQIRLTHSTPGIAADYRAHWGLEIPVLPHPSTTFSDAEAARRAAALPAPVSGPPLRVLFPGGARAEKGFALSMDVAADLARDPAFDCHLRARLDKVSGPALKAAFEALDTSRMTVIDDDLSDADFIAMIEAADIVVLPYHTEAFARRTSGILVDATLLGKPVVVLEGTWLAGIVEAEGIGAVAPPTARGIVAAVRGLTGRREALSEAVARVAERYGAQNGWAALLEEVRGLADRAGGMQAVPLPVPEAARAGGAIAARSAVAAGAAQNKPAAPAAQNKPAAQAAQNKPAPPKPAAPAADPGPSSEALRRERDALVAAVPTRAPIYLPTEKIALKDQVAGMRRVKRLYDTELQTLYKPRMKALRAAWKGHDRCFVIGNGPSLNRTDLSLLKDEVTFAVNGFFLKAEELDWQPTFYCVEDHLVAEDRVTWINALKGPVKLFPAYLRYVFPQGEDTIFFNHRPRKSYPHGFDFSTDASEVTYTGCTVTFTMMQLAFYLGFREIHLIGVDADYAIPADARQASDYAVGVIDMESDDPNHFHPDYFGKGFRWHDPQVDKMVEAYGEARRVVDGTDQRILNATVGGKLEVFERRDYADLFPRPAPAPETWPRLLVLDMTAMGNGSATGELKATLLRDWPADRILQVAARGPETLMLVRPEADGGFGQHQSDADAARAAIADFDPEVILYRPVPDVPHLHALAMQVIAEEALPLVTWIMDDWPERLKADADPGANAAVLADLPGLLERSALRLSICDAMSEAFETRYGQPFTALANGVDPAVWNTARIHRAGPVLLRYAGGLASDMTRDSVLRVARSVEALAREGIDIRFEIQTRKVWFEQSRELFDGFRHTVIRTETLPFDAYRRWLSEADITLIAYNFDAATRRYVRYSMANKMPECLASGAVLVVHGPAGLATVDALAEAGVAEVVTENSDAALQAALRGLAGDPARRNALAQAARRLVFERHSLARLRETTRTLLAGAAERAGQGASPVPGVFLYRPGDPAPQPVAMPPPDPDPDGGAGLLVCDDPAPAMAHAMQEGLAPQAALEAWREGLGAALRVLRRDRRRWHLVERPATPEPAAVWRALLTGLPEGWRPPAALRRALQPADPLLVAVADGLLRRDRAGMRLLEEARASALRPAHLPPPGGADAGAAVEAWRALTGEGDQLRRMGRAASAEERALREALAAARSEAAALRDTLAETRAGALAREAELTAASARLQERIEAQRREDALLRAQLDQLQATVEAYYEDGRQAREALALGTAEIEALQERLAAMARDREALSAEGADLAAERARLAAELDRVFRSRSWRVTEPLRGMRRAVGPGVKETQGS